MSQVKTMTKKRLRRDLDEHKDLARQDKARQDKTRQDKTRRIYGKTKTNLKQDQD